MKYIIIMQISFTERELKIIQVWSDNIIHGGHWGDGDVVFPDESILLEILDRAKNGNPVSLSLRNLEIMKIWSDSNSGTPEENLLRERLEQIINDCRRSA